MKMQSNSASATLAGYAKHWWIWATFIKLGQFLSVRRDCLSVEMADELAMLQDKVPPFPLELARKTIASELGALPEELFNHSKKNRSPLQVSAKYTGRF